MNPKPVVLVVEDDAILGPLYVEVLQYEHAWQVEWVSDGIAADARLSEITPDLLLLDLHLPGMSGRQLFQKIRADARLDQMKVAILTADGLRAKELEGAADLVLLKPVSHQKLQTLPALLHM